MIACITRILILVQVILALIFGLLINKIWQINNWWLALTLGISTIFVLRLLITANNFSLAWRYRSETPAAFQLNLYQACCLFMEEFRATMWSSSLAMPFQTFGRYMARHPAGLPVLLIHGYGCNSGYWRGMSKALQHAHITHHAIDMEPILGTIDAYTSTIQDAVETLCSEIGQEKIIIVAHSMGGLAARAYLRDYGNRHIAKVITLGTPHHGTALAGFSIGVNCREMQWRPDATQAVSSDWLQKLEQCENDATRALFVSIYSHHDNIISPQTSSRLPGAENIEFYGIGHVALGLNTIVQAKVVEEILLVSQAV